MKKKLLIIDIILIIISLLLFFFDWQEGLDSFIYQHFFFSNILTVFFKGITYFADTIIIAVIFFILLIVRKERENRKETLSFFLFSCISLLIMFVLKFTFKRARPNIMQLIEIGGFSFPSGHAFFSMLIYGYLIHLIKKSKRIKRKKIMMIGLINLIFLIGVSRIYLGVHYLTDIIFGYAIGNLCLLIFIYTQEKNVK